MNHSGFLFCCLWVSLLARPALPSPQGMANQAALVQQSTIIFAGTVTQLAATSFPDVPKSEQTIVVRVDSILKKPPAVSLKKGDNVTVEVKDPGAFRPGMEVTFYTDGGIFGSGVAVKEVSHTARPSGGKRGGAGAEEKVIGQVQQQISDQELRQRLASADFVV